MRSATPRKWIKSSLARITSRYGRATKECAALHTRRHVWARRALLIGGTVLGLLLLPGVFKPPLILFAVLWFLNGVGQALIAIPSSTLLAEHTDEAERGRAYAAHFALTHACWLITYPAIGYAAASYGTPATFTVAGVVCLLITTAALVFGRDGNNLHSHD